MKPRLRSSLRLKVALVIVVTCAVTLALAIGAFVAHEFVDLRDRRVARLGALASVTGENCKAALSFRDVRAAEETLRALAADPQVLGAAIYSREGKVFARYVRAGVPDRLPPSPPSQDHHFAPDLLALSRPIAFESGVLGTILVHAEVESLAAEVAGYVRLGAGVLLVGLLCAALLAYWLQRLVTGPVLRLAAAARDVAARKDYSVRVDAATPDEIGVLTGNFNQMLAQIERSDEALRESERRYSVAVAGARDGIWDWQLDSGQVVYSPRWMEILGCSRHEITATPEEWLERIHPEELERVRATLEEHLSGRSASFESEHRLRHHDGSWVWVLARGVALRDAAGRAIRIAGSLSDVTDRRGRDALTGLPNRLLFGDRVESALGRARRGEGHGFSVLLVDLERLRAINDVHGRSAGGNFLIAASVRIQSAIDYRDTLARLELGGFAILLEELGDATQAARVAGKILAALAPAFRVASKEVFTSAAIGIASSSTGYERPDEILRDAEAALERARSQGWNRFEVFDESVRALALARLELENELRGAVARGDLELFYQPIVRMDGQRLAGFEVLARWRRRNGESMPAGEFISLAEETGIIVPLGSWVLNQALGQLREWRESRQAPSDLMLSVNVSARQLARIELVDEVKAALESAGVPPELLKLEITESALIDDLESAGAVMRELQRIGVRFWLDDFGTGYSSLAYLQRFPLEAVKIDRSFVTALDDDSERRAIMEAVVALARALDIKSVAEGVETESQLRQVSTLRCDYAQGYAVSSPLGRDDVARLLRELDGSATTD